MPDILFILVLALIIFGPKRLPEVARQIAKFMTQFRMMRDDVRRQIENEILKIELEDKQKKAEVVPPPAQAGTSQLNSSAPPQLEAANPSATPQPFSQNPAS